MHIVLSCYETDVLYVLGVRFQNWYKRKHIYTRCIQKANPKATIISATLDVGAFSVREATKEN